MHETKRNKLANFIAVVHLFWVIWAVVSLPLVFIFDWYINVLMIFLILTLCSWIFFRECLFNRWEYKFRGLDYHKKINQGIFMSKVVRKFFSIEISGKTAMLIDEIFVVLLLIIALIRIF